MSLLKMYFDYMNAPEKALGTLLEERSFSVACVGYFAATLSWVLFFNIGSGATAAALLVKMLVVFVAELTAGYFLASFCGLYLDFSKVESSPAKLFVLIGSAGFIKSLLIAFALISAAFPAARLVWLSPVALLLVFGLQLGYLTRSIKRVYNISYPRALGAWLFAFVPVIVAFGLLFVFIFWGLLLLF